jgi:hypothetical protein
MARVFIIQSMTIHPRVGREPGSVGFHGTGVARLATRQKVQVAEPFPGRTR